MTRAVLSTAAERDILETVEWIAVENPAAARGLRAALDNVATTLGDHPPIGAPKPELASPPVRFIPLRGFPYVGVYTPDRDPPLILRVLQGARDLSEILRV